MALTRNMLKALNIEPEGIDEIINAHAETVEALKADRDEYKTDAEKAQSLEKENAKLKSDLEAAQAGEPSDLQEKYDKLENEYKAFQKQVEQDKLSAQKSDAYRQLLTEVGIDDKRLDSVLKISDLADVKLNDDGTIADAEDLKKSLKEEWKDFIPQTASSGAQVSTPPQTNQPAEPDVANMTVEEYAQYFKDRQKK